MKGIKKILLVLPLTALLFGCSKKTIKTTDISKTNPTTTVNPDTSKDEKATFTYLVSIPSALKIEGPKNAQVGDSVEIKITDIKPGYSYIGCYDENERLISRDETFNYYVGKANNIIIVHVSRNEYSVSVTKNIEEAGEIEGTGKHLFDTSTTLVAKPNKGYVFDGWYDGETKVCEVPSYTFTMPDDNVSLEAKFALGKFDIELSSSDEDKGSVSGAGTFEYLSEVTIVAEAETGYNFVGWYDGDDLVSNYSTYTFKMPNENISYEALFEVNKYSVAVDMEVLGYGTIIGEGVYDFDSTVTLKAEPSTGYVFNGWWIDGVLKESSETYSFKMPNNNVDIEAKFIPGTYSLSLACAVDGQGSVSGEGSYEYLSNVTIEATPNIGYEFDGWYNGGTCVSTEATNKFNMYGSNTTLTAKFNPKAEMSNFIFTSADTTCTITGITNKTVNSIVVPDYVTNIDQGAFSGCSALESITLPFIGDMKHSSTDNNQYPFGYIFGDHSYSGGIITTQYYYENEDNQSKIVYYYLPQTLNEIILTGSTYIQSHAFANCAKLKTITIPSSVTCFGFLACYPSSKFETIYYNGTLEQWFNIEFTSSAHQSNPAVGISNFYILDSEGEVTHNGNKYHSLENLEVPAGITKVSSYMFNKSKFLVTVTLPNTVQTVGQFAFSECSNLEGLYYDGTMEDFMACSSSGILFKTTASFYLLDEENGTVEFNGKKYSLVDELVIPGTVESIPSMKFEYFNITGIVLEEGVKRIESSAFYQCSNIETIVLPSSLEYVGVGAFTSVNDINAIYFNGTVEEWASIDLQDSINHGGAILYIYDEDGEIEYRGKHYSILENVVIPDSVTKIGHNFSRLEQLKSFTIGNGVTTIGSYAFRGCTCEIKWGTNPSITEIGEKAFSAYNGDYDLVIPEGVTSIGGEEAFAYCKAKNIVLPNSLLTISGAYAFRQCTSEIVWKDAPSITEIGEKAFYNYWGDHMVIPSSVTTLGSEAFHMANSLISLYIYANVSTLGNQVFSECKKLTTVIISTSVTTINSSAFEKITNMLKVYYMGNQSNWLGVTNNSSAINSNYVHYYSATTQSSSTYWHFDSDGNPVEW